MIYFIAEKLCNLLNKKECEEHKMSRGRTRGRRYDEEPKLNMKKVFAVLIAIIVIKMFIFIIKGLLSKETTTGKITTKNYFATYKDNKWGVIDSAGNDVIDP